MEDVLADQNRAITLVGLMLATIWRNELYISAESVMTDLIEQAGQMPGKTGSYLLQKNRVFERKRQSAVPLGVGWLVQNTDWHIAPTTLTFNYS